jgi:hypothetical protein
MSEIYQSLLNLINKTYLSFNFLINEYMSENNRMITVQMQENAFTMEEMNAIFDALNTISIERTDFQINGLIKFSSSFTPTPTPTPIPES